MTQLDPKARKRKQTLQRKMRHYLDAVSPTLCLDLINVIVCCRYSQSLLANKRIKRYLEKYHHQRLIEMERLIAEIDSPVSTSAS